MNQLLLQVIIVLKQLLILSQLAAQLGLPQPQISVSIPPQYFTSASSSLPIVLPKKKPSATSTPPVATSTPVSMPVGTGGAAQPSNPVIIQPPQSEATSTPKVMPDYTITLDLFVNGQPVSPGYVHEGQVGDRVTLSVLGSSAVSEALGYTLDGQGQSFPTEVTLQAGERQVELGAVGLASGTRKAEVITLKAQ